MSFSFSSLIDEWHQMRRFQRLNPVNRDIVFYAEDESSYPHFEPIIDSLLKEYAGPICYLTSAPQDKILKLKNERIQTFYVGSGMVRTILFKTLEAGVMIMTMPDLGSYYIQRSSYPVHYIYVYHSMVSTHMIYRKGAFDHYDTIFCVGPHHIDEIQKMENIYGLPAKTLFKHGYGKLDSVIQNQRKIKKPSGKDARKTILVAPSWGPNCLLETCGEKLIEILLSADYYVIVRPHPQTKRNSPNALKSIQERFSQQPNFSYEENIVSTQSLYSSDIMISDWSGAALEYSFGLELPVLFVDVPRKINNSEYDKILLEPLEVHIRSEIGTILPLDKIQVAPTLIEELCSHQGGRLEKIKLARDKWVFNVGDSGVKGAGYISQVISALEFKKKSSNNSI